MSAPTLKRRTLLAAAGGLALTKGSARAAGGRQALDLEDPEDALLAAMKCSGTLEDGVETIRWREGMVFALFEDGRRMEPLYGVVGVFPGRSWRQEVGSYRVASNNVIFYTDLATNRVIDEYDNPYTGERCEVHNHASVLNQTMRPSLGRTTTATSQVDSHWAVRMDTATQHVEATIRKPNPMDPKDWPRESSGQWYHKKMSNQMVASLTDLENPDLPSVQAVTASQRFGPWYPWMLMGGMAGRNFSHMTVYKARMLADVPRNILDYAETNKPEFLSAPREWTGEYTDPETLYTLEREPASG